MGHSKWSDIKRRLAPDAGSAEDIARRTREMAVAEDAYRRGREDALAEVAAAIVQARVRVRLRINGREAS